IWVKANIRRTVGAAEAIFVHSVKAAQKMVEEFGISDSRCQVIPFGDHAQGLIPPLERELARRQLGLDGVEKLCLMYGTINPYKGIEEVVVHWIREKRNCTLAVVGRVTDRSYATRLERLAEGQEEVKIQALDTWMDDSTLRRWLSAADCAVFNYREIFTSGAASLARSFGLPILIPVRLDCVDLMEPHSHVFRFDSLEGNFAQRLAEALAIGPSYAAGVEWREAASWDKVASLTAQVYERVLSERRGR
ncbi:MAG: hypothetical protein SNJ84_05530, partial [Verrucomicrobiia bacterium]